MKDKKQPEIRFSGYSDDWKLRKLNDIIEKQIKGKAQFEKLNIGNVEYLDTARLNGGKALLTDGIKDVTQDDILILWDGSKAGTVYSGFEGTLGSTLKAYKTSSDSQFVYQFLKRSQENIYNNYRTPNIPHVQKDFLDVFKINVPIREEQIKIGSLFKQLDNIIAIHKSKLELLKELKKGFLQKMFPKAGTNIPELRFTGFTDDWKQSKLKDIFDVHTDFVSNGSFQALKDNVKLYKTENYAYMIRLQDASNNWDGPWLYTDKKGFDFLSKSTVYKDDILMSDRGTIGKFFLVPQLSKPMTLSSNAVLLRSTKNDNNFIYYMLNTSIISNQIIVRTTPGVQPMISKTEFKKINTLIPNIKEQQKIGSLFKKIDDTIALQQHRLDQLKELKKGFLQKMFV